VENHNADSLTTMTRNACSALRYAGEPVTPTTLKEFIRSIPPTAEQLKNEYWRKQFFSHAMEKAHQRYADDPEYRLIIEYFLDRFIFREQAEKNAVIDSLIGIFGEIESGMHAEGLESR
jgi:hypothetical protein